MVTTTPQVASPAYVHDLLDLLLDGGGRLDFHDHPVPADVHRRLMKRTGRPAPIELSEREMQALVGMASGKSNREIGRELFISEDTVKTHARRLFRKLGARDRAHAVATGLRLGLIG